MKMIPPPLIRTRRYGCHHHHGLGAALAGLTNLMILTIMIVVWTVQLAVLLVYGAAVTVRLLIQEARGPVTPDR